MHINVDLILIQLPTVVGLFILSLQAAKIFKSLPFVYNYAAWGFNFCYLLCHYFLAKSFNNHIVIALDDIFDASSLYCFSLVYLKSQRSISVKWARLFRHRYLLPVYLAFLSVTLYADFNSVEGLIRLPYVLLSFASIMLYGLFFNNFDQQYTVKKYLMTAAIGYASIQFFDISNFQIQGISSQTFGFLGGMLFKLIILLSFLKLLLESVKHLTTAEQELKSKMAYNEKLSTIIGRTFHEVTPPLLEAETIFGKLREENAKYNDLAISRKVRHEIDQMENAIRRMSTILTASKKMYYSDHVNPDPWRDDNNVVLPLNSETDVHNINTLIQVAIMNMKAVVLADHKTINHVTNRIKFYAEFSSNCSVFCNSVEIVQIFYNLFKNSYEATEDCKDTCSVYIKTRSIRTIQENGDKVRNVVVEIEDDGPGIPAELQQNVFKQGFTTKQDYGRGRGFGLDIVKAFVEIYGGVVELESPVENPHIPKVINNKPGTKFTITFPKS